MRRAAKKRVEGFERFPYSLSQTIESWNNRLTPNDFRIGERYAKGELKVLLSRKVSIDFKSISFGSGHLNWQPLKPRRVAKMPNWKGIYIGLTSSGSKEPISFMQIKFVKSEESWRVIGLDEKELGVQENNVVVLYALAKVVDEPNRIIPSLVWFGSTQSFLASAPHCLYYVVGL